MKTSLDVTSLYNRRAVNRRERTSVGDLTERVTWSYRSLALGDSEHRPAGGRERSSAAWPGGRPRRPVAVFRHHKVAAAKPFGDPPSLAHVRRGDAQGVALTPGSVRSQWCHTCPSAHLRVSARNIMIALELNIVHETHYSMNSSDPDQEALIGAEGAYAAPRPS